MKIQINTDSNIEGKEALTAHVESVVESTLRHFKEHLSRVEIHLGDQKGGNSRIDDKRCMMEARLKSHQPVTASCQAGSLHEAIGGAASKLKSSLESVLGRLDNHHRHATVDLTGGG